MMVLPQQEIMHSQGCLSGFQKNRNGLEAIAKKKTIFIEQIYIIMKAYNTTYTGCKQQGHKSSPSTFTKTAAELLLEAAQVVLEVLVNKLVVAVAVVGLVPQYQQQQDWFVVVAAVAKQPFAFDVLP